MAVASLLLAPQLGWVATTTFAGQPGDSVLEIQARGGGLNRVWSMPSDESDSSNIGLGGGITYAWDPQLCAQLLPRFSEDDGFGIDFIKCEDIRAAVNRAFSSWTYNHPALNFVDVTDSCLALGWEGGVTVQTGAPAAGLCPLAELHISTKAEEAGADAVATNKNSYTYTTNFRFTNGRSSSQGLYMTTSAVIGFETTDACWYLDSSFCNAFHAMKDEYGSDAVSMGGRVLLWFLFTVALCCVLGMVTQAAYNHWQIDELSDAHADSDSDDETCAHDEHGRPIHMPHCLDDRREQRFEALMASVAQVHVVPTTLLLVLLVMPPTFYFLVFTPCWCAAPEPHAASAAIRSLIPHHTFPCAGTATTSSRRRRTRWATSSASRTLTRPPTSGATASRATRRTRAPTRGRRRRCGRATARRSRRR